MNHWYRYLNSAQAAVIHGWRRALDPAVPSKNIRVKDGTQPDDERPNFAPFNRGHRAGLRRAVDLAELQQQEAPYRLQERLGQMANRRLQRDEEVWPFLVAGAVAHVREDTHETRSLAFQLGSAGAKPGESAAMSELRFRRLLRAEDPDDFYLHLRRALQIAAGPVNAAVLADDVLAWWAERGDMPQPALAMRYRWARDYFLDRKDRNSASSGGTLRNSSDDFTQEPTA